ncbi:MAG: twin-arginine translocase TatA/TatE family subunit [Myxococcales bacterium]
MSVGPSELIVILIVVLLLFGSRRIADLGKGIGEGIRGFKRGIAGEDDVVAKPPVKSESPTGTPTADGVAQGGSSVAQADSSTKEHPAAPASENKRPEP